MALLAGRIQQRKEGWPIQPPSTCRLVDRNNYGIYSSDGGRLLFDWDDANLDHIAEHGIEPEEAEMAVLDPARVSRTAYALDGERRYALVGATEDGRHLFVVFTRRGSATRVISARDATDREKRSYRARRK